MLGYDREDMLENRERDYKKRERRRVAHECFIVIVKQFLVFQATPNFHSFPLSSRPGVNSLLAWKRQDDMLNPQLINEPAQQAPMKNTRGHHSFTYFLRVG